MLRPRGERPGSQVEVAWLTPDSRERANAYGYGRMQRELRAAAIAAGLVLRDDAATVFRCEPPLRFERTDDRPTVLLTMFESRTFPASLRPHLHDADALIVPSAFCVDVFRPHFAGPIWRCPLGVDTQLYRPSERRWRRGEVFSWLHVGAPNARKGADVIEAAWARHFGEREDMELYLKSSRGDLDYGVLSAAMREVGWSEVAEDLWTHGNVTLDMRRLSGHDLAGLYATADAFLFPTAGEGWGLTLHEALATALPSVCTRYGGHLDFTSPDTVQYVDGQLCAAELATEVNDGSETLEGALVQPDTLAAAMVAVMEQYPEHRQRARRAAQHVRQLTWAHAGQRLVRLLAGFTESHGRIAA